MRRSCSSECSDELVMAGAYSLQARPLRTGLKETSMKTRHLAIAAAAMTFVLRVGMAAQSSDASSGTIQQSRNVTITGCLQSVDESRSKPTGSASPGARPSTSNPRPSASSSANRFMLTGATSGANATKRDSSPGAAASGSTYVLEGQTAELRLHVNHQVEITGHVSSAYTSTGSSGVSGSRLNVSSVRTISPNCSR
jgi:hypothetical protein